MSNKVSFEVEILGKDGEVKKMTASIANALSRISGAIGELTKTNGLFLTNSKKPYHFLWLHRMISKNPL